MKVARLDNLQRENELFGGYEPDERYLKRQIIIVDDNYDFEANGATDITTDELLIEIFLNKYKAHELNGLDYFNNIRAMIALDWSKGVLSAADIFEIEGRLKSVTDRIKSGDWMTAQNELSSVTVEGALSQTLYDEINAYIINYIGSNY